MNYISSLKLSFRFLASESLSKPLIPVTPFTAPDGANPELVAFPLFIGRNCLLGRGRAIGLVPLKIFYFVDADVYYWVVLFACPLSDSIDSTSAKLLLSKLFILTACDVSICLVPVRMEL